MSLSGLPCKYSSCKSVAPSNCTKPTSGKTFDILLFLRSNVVSWGNPAKGNTFDIRLLRSDTSVRLTACCSPVRSRISTLFAVSVVNFNISEAVGVSSIGFRSVSIILTRRLASGIATGEPRRIAFAVNSTGSEISVAVTRTVVIPSFRPKVKCTAAIPMASVLAVLVSNLPLPAVTTNVTGTPANALFCSSRTSTINGRGNVVLTRPSCAPHEISRSVVGVRLSNVTSIPFVCMAGICVLMEA